MAVKISEVNLHPGNDLIVAAYLDYPRAGPVDGYAFEVFGWVVSKAPAAEVEFVHDGRVVARCALTVSRPDVASVYGSSSPVGFWKAIGTVGLAPAFTIVVRIVFPDGRRDPIAVIRGTQQLTSAFSPIMQPIMVTHPGRSGSTRLMRTLAEHPDIIIEERFPYETYIFSYWMHFLNVLATPADTSHAESLQFWTDPNRLPPFPYFFDDPAKGLIPRERAALDRWYASGQVEEFACVAQAAAESFYLEYASTRKRMTPTFFAEKIPPAGHTRWIMRLLYPRAREIFLFRDPRDHLASLLAFFPGDRRRIETDEQYVDRIRTRMLSLVNAWKGTPQYSTLVRYEDLVCSPAEQIRAMLHDLELDSSAKIVDSMVKAGNEVTANVTSHQTSPDAASSIGRWKRDLDPGLQKLCDEAFDGLLDELGGSSN